MTVVCSTPIVYARRCSAVKSRFTVVCEQILHGMLISSDFGSIDLSCDVHVFSI